MRVASVVKPIVRLFFPCEEALYDPVHGKWSLTNPLHTIEMPPGVQSDYVTDEFWLYAQLSGGVGTFNISVQLVEESGVILRRTVPLSWTMTGGFEVVQEVFQMPPTRFPRPGVYALKLIANHAELDGGISFLRVLGGQ